MTAGHVPHRPAGPAGPELRRRLRRVRRAHSDRTLGELLTDVYLIAFLVVLYGGSAAFSLRRHLAQPLPAPVGARHDPGLAGGRAAGRDRRAGLAGAAHARAAGDHAGRAGLGALHPDRPGRLAAHCRWWSCSPSVRWSAGPSVGRRPPGPGWPPVGVVLGRGGRRRRPAWRWPGWA